MPADPDLAAVERTAARHVREVARHVVLPTFGAAGPHQWESHTQVRTEADDRVAVELAQRFSVSFPGHGLVIEDHEGLDGDGVHEWFIDPIDGSANHLRGIPYVAVTAGLVRDGERVVGVVHDLIRGVTFSASRGGGVTVRHGPNAPGRSPARVADTAHLGDAMLIAHLSRKGPLVNRPGALPDLLRAVRKIRCMGSIALDFALLAAGEADLLVVGRGRPQRMLDIVGGMVLLEEAGGVVMTAGGDPVDETTHTLVAGPPALCDALVERMAPYDLEGWRAEMAAPST